MTVLGGSLGFFCVVLFEVFCLFVCFCVVSIVPFP